MPTITITIPTPHRLGERACLLICLYEQNHLVTTSRAFFFFKFQILPELKSSLNRMGPSICRQAGWQPPSPVGGGQVSEGFGSNAFPELQQPTPIQTMNHEQCPFV